MLALYLKAFVAMFVVMDPIGNIPPFLSVTQKLERKEQIRAYTLSVMIAFAILIVFGLAGQLILNKLFQISIADLQIAGGILLFWYSIRELATTHTPEEGQTKLVPKTDEIACVPLACPLLAGPGALITILTLWHSPEAGPIPAITATASILILFWLMMRSIDTISRFTGKLILTVISKVMLILLAAIAVKMTIQGFQFYFPAIGQ